MKSLKIPHTFKPQAGLSAEDVNRNLHHLVKEKENSNKKRYGYGNIKIPFSVFASGQVIGLNPNTDTVSRPGGAALGTRPQGQPLWNPRRLHKRNHEALRSFSFVPPEDLRVVSTELFCKADFVLAEGTGEPLSPTASTDVTVSFYVNDGGEGYPARPASVLPIGFETDLDAALEELHPILTMSFTTDELGATKILSSNAEYLLKKDKCYRVMISSPSEQTYYKSCYFDIRYQYDRFQGADPAIPNLDFVNSTDKVEKGKLVTNLQGVVDDAETELGELRTVKSELFYFGIGEMNGRFKRSAKRNTGGVAYQSTMQSFTNITAGANVTDEIWDANELFNFICDFEQFWFNDAAYDWDKVNKRTLLTEMAFEFFDSFTCRTPMAPRENFFDEAASSPQDSRGNLGNFAGLREKVILGYSLGILHNSSFHHCMFQQPEKGYHYGLAYDSTIGHGLRGDATVLPKPHFWANAGLFYPSDYPGRYVAVKGNDYDPTAPDPSRRNFRAIHLQETAGDTTTGQQPGFETIPDIAMQWRKNSTPFASTMVPNCNHQKDILNTGVVASDSTYTQTGHASGIPGTYLAELHNRTPFSINSYGTDASQPSYLKSSMSTDIENFRSTGRADGNISSLPRTNDIMIDLFLTVATYLSNSGRDKITNTRDASTMYRHMQKMYMLLWVG